MEKLKVRIEESIDQASRLENIAYYILLATAFLLPIFFIPSAAFQFQFSKAVFVSLAVLVAVALWLIARLKDGRYPIPNNLVFWGSGLVLIVILISALSSISLRASFIGQGFETGTWASTAVFFLMLFLFATLFRPKERVFYLYLTMFASCLIIVLFHALRFALGSAFMSFGIFTDITSNLIGKWNDLGIFFALITILSLITVELVQLTRAFKALLWVVFSLSLLSLTIVNFRTLWYALAFFSILYFVYAYAYKRFFKGSEIQTEPATADDSMPVISSGRAGWRKVRRGSVAAALLVVLSLIFLIDNYTTNRPIGTWVADKFKVSYLEVRPNWSSTLEIAGKTLKSNPVFGAGPNRFVNEWLLYKPDGINESVFWDTDFSSGIGLLPTQLVTSGVAGFIAWALLILSIAYIGIRALLSPVTDKLLRYLSVSSFFASAFLWTFFIFYIPSTVILSFTFLFTGIFLASLYNERLLRPKTISFSDEPKIGFVSVLVLTVLLVIVVTLSYAFGKKFIASAYFQKAVNEINTSGNLERTEQYVTRAQFISKSDLYDRLLTEISLSKLNTLLANTPASASSNQEQLTKFQAEFQSLLGDALRYAREATELDGTNYQNWESLGRVYESVVPLKIDGAYESALQAYEKVLAWNPQSPRAYLTNARLEQARNNNAKAKDEINKALALKGNYTEAVFVLSQIQVAEGNVRDAIAGVESIAAISPNNTTIFFQLGLLKYNNRDYRGAVTALERAVVLTPSYSNAKYFLGLSYNKLGMTTKALTQFNDILTLNPGNAEVPIMIENIKAGKDPFASIGAVKPESRDSLPVEEEKVEDK